jgi:tetratricopeptide (TPR) repeat protein
MSKTPGLRSKLRVHLSAASACLLVAICAAFAQVEAPVHPPAATTTQTPQKTGFRAVSYEVFASLNPENQMLTARAIVEFEAQSPSRAVDCELHPNLSVSEVRDAAGKALEIDRGGQNGLDVVVSLTDVVPRGQRIKLSFNYSGVLANEENSPISGVRLASIGKDGAYLLLPARWFPLTDYPANRFTGVFHIEVPQNFVVVGTGSSQAPAPASAAPATMPMLGNRNPEGGNRNSDSGAPRLARRRQDGVRPDSTPSAPPSNASTSTATDIAANSGPRVSYTFRVDQPEAAGTFVAGGLQLFPIQAEGLNISVYLPPSAGSSAQEYGGAVARIVNTLSDQFGPLPNPNLVIAQIPDGTLPTYSAPGVLLVTQRQWTPAANSRQLANIVAAQWWGNQVMAASPSDTWLTDGLSRYSEALYVEQTAGRDGMNKALNDFAIGALMYDDSAPIDEAGRLAPFTPNYTSVIVNKGAMVFHMLREQLGDSAFSSLLRDYYKQFAGKAASLADFEKLAQDHVVQAPAPAKASNFALGNAAPAAAPSGSESADAEETTPANVQAFFAQWINSTGIPEFNITYTVYRTKTGFRIDGRIKQNLDFFHMPVEIEVQTEGNPEIKTVEVSGTDSSFTTEVFGRPKPGGIILDPHNYILKSNTQIRVRAIIARGETLAEQGRYYDAIQQYQQALDQQKDNALAEFRMAEAFFYQKNYSAAANAFRDSLDANIDPSFKWVEVWAHIYLGKVYDIAGDRARAVNEYSKAQQTNDDTGGAQDEAKKYLAQPYKEGA